MKCNYTFLLLLLLLLLLLSTHSSLQSCKSTCGMFPIHYPFGTGPGCGSPAFQCHVTCDENHNLIFTTHTGSYPVQSIDYTNQILYIQDPSMSTCTTTNPSAGFALDWDAPFTFVDGNIFALLDCSTSPNSPLYSTNSTNMCDANNAPVCSLLYTCPAITQLDVPISTCCIYSPVSLGPSFEMDLKKLECTSYSGIYSFGAAETNPPGWKFGIALKYRFSVDDGYPSACADCEKSNGVCGYTGQYDSFTVTFGVCCRALVDFSHGLDHVIALKCRENCSSSLYCSTCNSFDRTLKSRRGSFRHSPAASLCAAPCMLGRSGMAST